MIVNVKLTEQDVSVLNNEIKMLTAGTHKGISGEYEMNKAITYYQEILNSGSVDKPIEQHQFDHIVDLLGLHNSSEDFLNQWMRVLYQLSSPITKEQLIEYKYPAGIPCLTKDVTDIWTFNAKEEVLNSIKYSDETMSCEVEDLQGFKFRTAGRYVICPDKTILYFD